MVRLSKTDDDITQKRYRVRLSKTDDITQRRYTVRLRQRRYTVRLIKTVDITQRRYRDSTKLLILHREVRLSKTDDGITQRRYKVR